LYNLSKPGVFVPGSDQKQTLLKKTQNLYFVVRLQEAHHFLCSFDDSAAQKPNVCTYVAQTAGNMGKSQICTKEKCIFFF